MMNERLSFGGRSVGLGAVDPTPAQSHLSPLLTFPVGGAVIGGLIGYGIKRDASGAAVGALIGAASPFVLAVAVIASGWRP
jgi:hypothetical protein